MTLLRWLTVLHGSQAVIVIHGVKGVLIRSYSGPHFSRIFLYSDWIRRDTLDTEKYFSVFSPNVGKSGKNADQNNSEYGLFLRNDSAALLDLFLSSDASICCTMAFPPFRNSDHVVVSVFTDFPSSSQRDSPFHRIAYDYSRADWDGLHDHLRDVPWEDIFQCFYCC